MANLSSVSGSARSHTALAAAIVIAAVLISTALFMTSSASDTTITETTTETNTTVEMTTLSHSATTMTSSKTINSTRLRVYELVFQQVSLPCGILSPWAVTLGNRTVVEPSNGTIPTDSTGKPVPPSFGLTTIEFSVAPGSYNYTLSPSNIWNQTSTHDFGFVTVIGSDVTVQIQAIQAICSS